MYGYEPRKDPEPGSWSEIFLVIRVVFGELAKPLGFMVLLLALIISMFMLLFSHPLFAVIPLAGLGGIAWWFIRRDRAAIRDAEDALPPWK